MTKLLHMSDNYLRSFDATVISSGEGYVVLDMTAFYPEGGGQSSDRGTLSDGSRTVNVTEVRKIEGEIRHKFDGPSFEVGTKIQGELDWEYRYECMRFHTAQHILSRHLQLKYEVENELKFMLELLIILEEKFIGVRVILFELQQDKIQ